MGKGNKKYALGGYHILAADSLKADLKENIYHDKKNEGMQIPRYMLLDKNGIVVLNEALFAAKALSSISFADSLPIIFMSSIEIIFSQMSIFYHIWLKILWH